MKDYSKDYNMEGFDLSPEFKAKISEHIRICVQQEVKRIIDIIKKQIDTSVIVNYEKTISK